MNPSASRRYGSFAKLLSTLGALFGFVALLGSVGGMSLAFYPCLFSMPIIVFASVLIHEGGHAAAAIVTGGRVLSFLAVPFEILFRPLRIGIRTKAESGDIGGLVRVLYPENRRSVRRMVGMVAAGPLANLIVGVALLTWAAHSLLYQLAQGIAAGIGWTSIGMGLANLLPCFRGRHQSDGLRLINLLRTRGLSEGPPSPKSPA